MNHIKIALMALLLFSPLMVLAEVESEYFAEGKSWVEDTYNRKTKLHTYTTVTVCGDTIIDGLPAKRLINDSGVEIEYPWLKDYLQASAYEENGKIWYNVGYQTIPSLDFSVTTGDMVPVWDTYETYFTKGSEEDPDYYYEVIDDRIINLYGIDRRVLTLQWDSDKFGLLKFCWIEGIGTHALGKRRDLLFYQTITTTPVITGCDCETDYDVSYGAIECYQGDRLLYSYDDFENQLAMNAYPLAAIKGVEYEPKEVDSTIYDLMGRVITGEPSPGLYIIGGKKVLIR